VTSLAGATGLFIWEICCYDGTQVIQRSTKSFPTRIEDLRDSTREAAARCSKRLVKFLFCLADTGLARLATPVVILGMA
jgi:hypothetical protein